MIQLSSAHSIEELLSKLKELTILKSVRTAAESYSSLVDHIATTIENDNKKHYGSVIQKGAHFKLTSIVKRKIIRFIQNVAVTQVRASASAKKVTVVGIVIA
jgi:hypothetical protein